MENGGGGGEGIDDDLALAALRCLGPWGKWQAVGLQEVVNSCPKRHYMRLHPSGGVGPLVSCTVKTA